MKAFAESTTDISWQEKADLLDALLHYIPLLRTSPDEAADFYSEKIMKRFRTKLRPAVRTKLFWHLDKEMGLVETGIIDSETFNKLPAGEQGITEEEYPDFLNSMSRAVKMLQYEHYTFTEEEEKPEPDTLGDLNTKGRIQRTPGDNLTKLSQEQTALLVDYLKRGSIVLKGDYLNDKTAGLALALLTGFSPESLRQKISPAKRKEVLTKKNLEALHDILTNITILIKRDLKELP